MKHVPLRERALWKIENYSAPNNLIAYMKIFRKCLVSWWCPLGVGFIKARRLCFFDLPRSVLVKLIEVFLISKKELPVRNLLPYSHCWKPLAAIYRMHFLCKLKWYVIYFWCQRFIFAILNKKLCRCIFLRKQKLFLSTLQQLLVPVVQFFFFFSRLKIFFFMCKPILIWYAVANLLPTKAIAAYPVFHLSLFPTSKCDTHELHLWS
jgi:hypothetical protein